MLYLVFFGAVSLLLMIIVICLIVTGVKSKSIFYVFLSVFAFSIVLYYIILINDINYQPTIYDVYNDKATLNIITINKVTGKGDTIQTNVNYEIEWK